jgi:hypothetical protein
MGAYKLAEITVDLIETAIRQNIATTLANVRTERADPTVSTEPPREYFQYETAQVYRAPAVFTIIRNQDIRDSVKNANHINSLCEVIVAVVVEDRLERLVTKKAWRYQSALMPILHQVTLTTADLSVRLFSRVQNCEFSGIINLKNENRPDAVFRKEVSLRLQVEHIENLQGI